MSVKHSSSFIREETLPIVDSTTDHIGHVKRKLKARHLQMIAIGGTIGTGLFVASGTSLARAGPLGCLIAYMTVGIMVFFVVSSLGEMATLIPVSGSFNTYASRFIDEALGFTMGWNYWLSWAIALPTEISAITVIMSFWLPDVPSWVWCIILIVLLFGLNVLGVEGFGEAEYWFSLIKVMAVVVFIILGTVIAAGGLGKPAVGFKNWNIPPGPIVNGIIGIFGVYTTAFFSYGGTELVGVTAGEAENPRKSVPRAINGTFWRISLFYVLSIFILGLLIPYNDPRLSLLSDSKDGSLTPFTLAFENAGIESAAHFMNAVILIAALSAGNSSLYATSRTMMALAEEGKAPAIFSYTTSWGVPMASLLLSTAFGFISFLGSSVGSNVVFFWLTNITGMSSLMTWILICVTHLRFRKAYIAQGYRVENLPYRSPFFPYGQYLAILMGLVVLVGEGYSTIEGSDGVDWVKIVGVYIGVPFYVLLYVVYKWMRKTTVVPLMECDLQTGIAEFADEDDEESEKELLDPKQRMKRRFKKVIHFLA